MPEKKEAGNAIEIMRVNGNQPDGGMLHLFGQRKKTAKKAVYKAFVGNAEELCERYTGMGGKSRQNQEWWITEDASAIREKKEAWKVIDNIRVNENQPDVGMLRLRGHNKKQQLRKLYTRTGMTW